MRPGPVNLPAIRIDLPRYLSGRAAAPWTFGYRDEPRVRQRRSPHPHLGALAISHGSCPGKLQTVVRRIAKFMLDPTHQVGPATLRTFRLYAPPSTVIACGHALRSAITVAGIVSHPA